MRLDPLQRLQLDGFKSIRSMDLEIRRLNVLVGANGSGKSNLISLFGMLQALVSGHLQGYVARSGGPAQLLHYGPKRTPQMTIRLHFGANSYEAVLAYGRDNLFFESENAIWFKGGSRPIPAKLGRGHLETRLPEEVKRRPTGIASYVHDALDSWRVYHFHDTSPEAAVKQPQAAGDADFLRQDASNLAPFLLRLRSVAPRRYQLIRDTVREVAPFFDDFLLRTDVPAVGKVELAWKEVDSDAYFPPHALSDGTLRFICLATLLLQPDLPSLVVIDEPELGLHPFAIQKLAGLFEAAATKTSLLVATQSVTLLNQLDPEAVVVVDRRDGQSTFERMTAARLEDWFGEYALGEVWEKNVFGGRPQRP